MSRDGAWVHRLVFRTILSDLGSLGSVFLHEFRSFGGQSVCWIGIKAALLVGILHGFHAEVEFVEVGFAFLRFKANCGLFYCGS